MSDKWKSVLAGERGSAASNPAGLTVSDEKLRELRPELYGFSQVFYTVWVWLGQQDNEPRFIREFLNAGDSRAAVVVSLSPLLVAAYSDELDCIAMLRFPDHLAQRYRLQVGTRLLSVNCYLPAGAVDASDLAPGPRNTGHWGNMIPTIAEFVSDDVAQIEQLKRGISEDEWRRAYAMGVQYLQGRSGIWRDGRPYLSSMILRRSTDYQQRTQRAQQARMRLSGGCAAVVLMMLTCCGVGVRIVSLLRKGLPPLAIKLPNVPARQPRAAIQQPRFPQPPRPPVMPRPPQPPVMPRRAELIPDVGPGGQPPGENVAGTAEEARPGVPRTIPPRPAKPSGRPPSVMDRDAPGTEVDDSTSLPPGTAVYARWTGRWVPGTVVGQRGLTFVVVRLDDSAAMPGRKNNETTLPRRWLRLRTDSRN